MRNLKISSRLAIAFGTVLLLLILMSSIGAWRILDAQGANEQNREFFTANYYVSQWSRQIEVNINQAMAIPFIANGDVLVRYRDAMLESDKKAEEIRNSLSELVNSKEAIKLFAEANNTADEYIEKRDHAFLDWSTGDFEKANLFIRNELPQLGNKYINSIDALSELIDRVGNQTLLDDYEENQLGLTILGSATVLALLLGALFAWLVSRSIANPLSLAVDFAAKVANGDLAAKIMPKGKDEVTKLEESLLNMSSNLRNNVDLIRKGSDSIAAAASQISAGNLDLSSRTEQQASSLAETAATMEQITATVKQNADNTEQANSLALDATNVASEGGKTVNDLVDTMAEINEKSQQVVDIIDVIDSIAFQTNILALNAAVEAARAGEQGRGFAVVAAEVRALAQRSANSAREIKDLIDSSVESTVKGNQQAEQAGSTMQEIVDSIHRVTSLMSEVNAANREQTTGIEEINSAVMQMDDVTRQNASLVEESAAAAKSLEEQAETLANLVAAFKLDDGVALNEYA